MILFSLLIFCWFLIIFFIYFFVLKGLLNNFKEKKYIKFIFYLVILIFVLLSIFIPGIDVILNEPGSIKKQLLIFIFSFFVPISLNLFLLSEKGKKTFIYKYIITNKVFIGVTLISSLSIIFLLAKKFKIF
jgi:hypothetical protein